MNTIAQIEDYILFGCIYRKGKTILVYTFALRRFDFNYLELCINELLYAHCIKEKERSRGRFLVLLLLGSIIQKNFD